MKTCPKCKRSLQETEFYRRRDRAYSLQSTCKECTKKARKNWYLENVGTTNEFIGTYGYAVKKKDTSSGMLMLCRKGESWTVFLTHSGGIKREIIGVAHRKDLADDMWERQLAWYRG